MPDWLAYQGTIYVSPFGETILRYTSGTRRLGYERMRQLFFSPFESGCVNEGGWRRVRRFLHGAA